jgi:tetraacyldisaccharide 4'-kinase
MNFIRKLLFPFSFLYYLITGIRNFLYDKQILKSYSFSVPIVAVGNLSTGGTGKTPQIEYLIRLLSNKYKIATLSRGYKRKSNGFVLANADSDAEILGDEPFQFFKKFPEIQVAVDANRKNGIENLLNLKTKPEVVLLDDAFQHRKVKAGFYILLTAYNDLFVNDFILPTGNLREGKNGAKRADCIVVTKCPGNLSGKKQEEITDLISSKSNKKAAVFFSFIEYDEKIFSETHQKKVSEIKNESKLLIAGIAKPKPFFDYLKNENDTLLSYPDHHSFSDSDLTKILATANKRIIVTTEKDYVRLKGKLPPEQLFYLPIKSNFISNNEEFDTAILNFVASSSK